MMVIPAIDVMGGQVVRLYRGDPRQKTVYGDDPAAVARRWEEQGADMLHVVDLDATIGTAAGGGNAGVIRGIAGAVSIPVQVGGGLRDGEAVARAAVYADRVVVGTIAFENPRALRDIARRHGASRIVISVDHSDGFVVTHGWQRGTQTPMLEAVRGFVADGFTEFLLTDVGRDGTMEGPDLDHLEEACAVGGANVIASGGIAGAEDVARVRKRGASAVILGRALYEDRITIGEARRVAD